MKPFNLDDLLRRAQVPEPDAASLSRLLHDLQPRLAAPPRARQPARRPRTALGFAFGAAICGLMAGFLLGHRPGVSVGSPNPAAPAVADSYARLKSGQALRDYLPLYLGRLQAIEQNGNQLHLVLSPQTDVPSSLPVWVEFDDGQHRQSLDILSGQKFRVGSEQIEVLANPDGEVMLIGRDFIWTNRDPVVPANGLRVQAKLLPQIF